MSEPREATADVSFVRRFFREHADKLWWVHSLYALGIGVFVVLFARRGFAYARWLTLILVAIFLVTALLFRVFGSGRARQLEGTGAKVRYYVMTYVLKNLYQAMLFFALPFYWQSTSFDSPNRWFVVVLAVCAVVSTLDLVFDNVLMRWRAVASTFYVIVLFATLNLAVPALLPGVRLAWAVLAAAAGSAIAFWLLHVSPALWARARSIALLAVGVATAVGAAWFGQPGIPPVPLVLVDAAVGPELLPDGRLALSVTSIHRGRMTELHARTTVGLPDGAAATADQFRHVWRFADGVVHEVTPSDRGRETAGTLSLGSSMPARGLPDGGWSVDVQTADGQLVGRARFEVLGELTEVEAKKDLKPPPPSVEP